MEKDYTFDYVRVIAMFVIVLGHFFVFCTPFHGIGRYLGGGGYNVFFFLSALLYGIKWENSGRKSFDLLPYLQKRVLKLGASVWPFLIILLVLLYICNEEFSIRDAVLNFFFLGYIGKLPGNGHLWFLTIIMLCYVMFVVLSSLKLRDTILLALLVLSVLGFLFLENIGFPGHPLLLLASSAIFFCHSKSIMEIIRTPNPVILLVLIVMFNGFCVWLFANGLFEKSRIWTFIIVTLVGISWMALLLLVAPNRFNKVIAFFSGISFEVYIVHHTLCQGPLFSMRELECNPLLKLTILLLLSILLGFILNRVSGYLSKLLFLFVK